MRGAALEFLRTTDVGRMVPPPRESEASEATGVVAGYWENGIWSGFWAGRGAVQGCSALNFFSFLFLTLEVLKVGWVVGLAGNASRRIDQ